MSVYEGHGVTLHHGDCLDVLRSLPDCSVDSVVTDPPYNLSFMAKPWDAYEGREDAGFAYWLSGLIDGEGHFAIKAHSRGTHAPYFQLKMRADERGTLDRIRRLLGVGVVSIESKEPNPMAKYVIQDKAGCQRLVDLLDKYPLRAKKQLDYWTWREAVCEWTSRPRGNRWHGAVDNAHMAELRSRLMENRAYTDVPWSGHEFQDWCRLWAVECLRVLKPGGHLLAFGGTRTWHRLACAVEDAGFEMRDSIAWLYGSGFPKSLDVSKAIDKRRTEDVQPAADVARWLVDKMEILGVTRRDICDHFEAENIAQQWTTHWVDGAVKPRVPRWEQWQELRRWLDLPDDMDAEVWRLNGRKGKPGDNFEGREVLSERVTEVKGGSWAAEVATGRFRLGEKVIQETAPATDAAREWEGWGTALKPAFEPVVVARKPLKGTVAANVLAHGTGALNIDGCRNALRDDEDADALTARSGGVRGFAGQYVGGTAKGAPPTDLSKGRWPANVVLDEEMARRLDEQSGESRDGVAVKRNGVTSNGVTGWGTAEPGTPDAGGYGGQGGASRFFPTFRYEAKAPTSERPRYKREGGSDNATTYGQMKKRECNVCGNRTCPAGGEQSGKPWPTCGHDDWSWVEQQSARDEFVAHPTVKPLDLMRWLVRLVTPPGGLVLDPFAGSGTTAEACILEGFRCVTIDKEPEHLPLILQRINRQRDPVEAIRQRGEDLGLFDHLEGAP